MSTEFEDGLLRYLASREQSRRDSINRALGTLRPYERRLVVEAAVMGYVRGTMNGRARAALRKPREGDIPLDSEIVAEVIDCCIAMDDRYPYLADASEGRRRRVTAGRKWPGEDAAVTTAAGGAEGDQSNGGTDA